MGQQRGSRVYFSCAFFIGTPRVISDRPLFGASCVQQRGVGVWVYISSFISALGGRRLAGLRYNHY